MIKDLNKIFWALIICICCSVILHIYMWTTGQWDMPNFMWVGLFIVFHLLFCIVINRNKQ